MSGLTYTLEAKLPLDWRRPGAIAGLVGLGATSILLAVAAAGGASRLVPAGRAVFPGWLAGPFSLVNLPLGASAFKPLLLGMCASYLLVLAGAARLRAGVLLAGIVATQLVFLAAPPLLSADAFGYLAYARLGALHHLDPYAHSAAAAPHDPVFAFLGWHHSPSPYGPLFTVVSYALVPLGLAGGLWTLKLLAAASSLAIVAIVRRLAALRGSDPERAAAIVGLNPLLLVYGVGGAHNDLLVTALVIAAATLALAGRRAVGGATLVAAAAMKASAALLMPLMAAASSRRRGVLLGAAAALLAVGILAAVMFGVHGAGFAGQVREQQRLVATESVPSAVGRLLGLGGLTAGIRLAALGAFVAAFALALARARRGDWIAPAGWSTLALLATTAWLLPWYVIWLLPLAAVSGDRRLEAGTLAFTAYVVAARPMSLLG
jgi:hypothetical protein